jgi:hypothetical protein
MGEQTVKKWCAWLELYLARQDNYISEDTSDLRITGTQVMG